MRRRVYIGERQWIIDDESLGDDYVELRTGKKPKKRKKVTPEPPLEPPPKVPLTPEEIIAHLNIFDGSLWQDKGPLKSYAAKIKGDPKRMGVNQVAIAMFEFRQAQISNDPDAGDIYGSRLREIFNQVEPSATAPSGSTRKMDFMLAADRLIAYLKGEHRK